MSDHTNDILTSLSSIPLDVKIIEKHFILDRSIGGPDASFSMTEQEFAEMVNVVREAEKAIGVVDYNLTEKQKKGKDFSRSLYVVHDINEGGVITEENIRSIRPGFGLHPKYFNSILGSRVKQTLYRGDRVFLEHLYLK